MSCCHECEQSGMGGCGSSQFQLLGGLLEAPLLGAMLAKGSFVRVGFAYDIWNPESTPGPEANDDPKWISEVIRGALLGSGEFESAEVIVTPSAYVGFKDGYILIRGTTYVDKGDPEDVGSLAQGLIKEYLPLVNITRRDYVIIESVPASERGKQNVAQVNAPPDTTPRGNSPGQPPPPGECDWDSMTFGNYVACQLGIKDAVSGIAAGSVGALVGVGVITVAAIVLLKR